MVRKTSFLFCILTLILLFGPNEPGLHAGGSGTKGDAGFIKVEAQGKLKTGIFAIGGETTGTILNTGTMTVELDFGKDQKLRDLAKELDNKTVVVTGLLTSKAGVTLKKARLIVQVKTMKEAK